MKLKYLILLAFAFILINSCSEETQKNLGLTPVPNAFGDINELVVVADQALWDGPVGDTLRFYYSSAYPILPQPEPILDLRHYTPEELGRAPDRKELRNYLLLADLKDNSSATSMLVKEDIGNEKVIEALGNPTVNSVVGRDKWAKGQLVIYQFAASETALIDNLKKNFSAIINRIRSAGKEKIDATIFFRGDDQALMEQVRSRMGITIRIPKDYFMALDKEELMWIRKETEKLSSNIMITKRPFRDESQLTKDYIKSLRDSLGKFVSTDIPNSYMKVNDIDLPMLVKPINLSNQYALEARGIWEIQNDYMGGAFITYLIHNPNKNELVYIDGFVHAPGTGKRDVMQHLEYIINTVNL
ncbi:MAG: DUF4837 family protein [Bacteroidota bacterium]